jgi:hypothetical protein
VNASLLKTGDNMKHKFLLVMMVLICIPALVTANNLKIKRIPFSVSVLPALGMHIGGDDGVRYSKVVSLNVLGVMSDDIDGLEVSSLFSLTRYNMYGFQASGVFNQNGGRVIGMQTAGIANLANGKVNGVQTAGICNVVNDRTAALQTAGIINTVKGSMYGFQAAGLINVVNGNSFSLQTAGLVNVITKAGNGVQAAGLMNLSDVYHGAQFAGLINIAGNFKGFQAAGLINVAGDAEGVQLGVINISKSLNGLPLGLFNYSADGERHGLVSYDSSGTAYTSFKSGTQQAYTSLSISYNQSQYAGMFFSYGLERPIKILYLNLEASYGHPGMWKVSGDQASFSLQSAAISLTRLKAGINFRIFKHLTIFAGMQYSLMIDKQDANPVTLTSYDVVGKRKYFEKSTMIHHRNTTLRYWPGIYVGVQL